MSFETTSATTRAKRRVRLLALLGTTLLSAAGPARAATFVLDSASGANYDAVGDGWFFTTPPGLPPDGVGDLGGNALAVGIQSGVVELRALAEYPLASLSSVGSANIQSATLTFQIDDVIGTFGPGTLFDGTASDPIAVYSYPANGTVTVADFNPPGLSSVAIVPVGLITDATLAITGPINFDVDVTTAIKNALDNGDVALGILFGTLDTPTATSLDGVLPFITVETFPTDPPVFGRAELKCQTAIAKQAGLFAKKKQQQLTKCFDKVLKAVSAGGSASSVQAKCVKALDESNPTSLLAKARATALSKITSACTGLTPAAINSPCDGAATDFVAVGTCVLDNHQLLVERMVKAEYRNACAIINSVGLGSGFPELCAP